MNFNAEQINKAFDELPRITSKAIFSLDLDKIKSEIIERYSINSNIAIILDGYITFTLIGLLKVEDFKSNIIKELQLPIEICEKINDSVNKSIFKVIEEKKKEFEEVEKEYTMSTPVPLPPYKNESPVIDKIEIPNPSKDTISENHLEEETHRILSDSGIDIIGSKLANSTVSAPKISDHSLPKMSQEKDPYKEEI